MMIPSYLFRLVIPLTTLTASALVTAIALPAAAEEQSAAAQSENPGQIEGAITLDTELLLNAPVITATGREQSRALAPANVVTWESDELRRHGWTTLAQVLANTPGLYVIDDMVIPSLGVRGVGAGLRGGTRLVRIMINGVQVNFRPDLTAFLGSEYIPFSVVERIEIAKGPLSALYGANAFLATVNIITKKPVNGLAGQLGGNAQIVNGNAGLGFNGEAGFGNEMFSAMAAYSNNTIDRSGLVLHRTFENQDPTGANYAGFFDQKSQNDKTKPQSLYALLEGRFGKAGILQLQGGRQALDAVAEFQPNSVLTHASRQKLANNWGSASYIYGYGESMTLSVTGGFSSGGPGDGDRLFVSSDPRFSYTRNGLSYNAFDVGAAGEFSLPAHLELKVGGDYTSESHDVLFYTQRYEQRIGTISPGFENERGVAQSRDLTNLGIYAQLGGNPIDALPDLYVLGNIRYDDPNLFDQQLSWRTGLAYQWSDRVTTKLFFGRAFQVPSAVQLFAQPGFGSSFNVIGNRALVGQPALNPQSVISAELATTIAVSTTLAIDSALYYQQIRNKIEFVQLSNNFTPRNLSDQDFVGGELGLRGSSSRFGGYAYGSVQLTKNENERESGGGFGFKAPAEFPLATLFGGATVRLPEAYMAVDLTGRIVGPRGASQSNYLLNNRTNYNLRSYATFDLTLTSLDLTPFGEGYETRITASARNLLGVRYSEPSHGGFDLPTVGRTFFFSLAQTF